MLQRSYKDEDAAVPQLLCHSDSKRCQGKEQMYVLEIHIYIPDSQIGTQIIPAKIILKTTTKNSSNDKFLNHFAELPQC